ncbi:MAG: MoxR family ATPase [Propionibacteriaceae bacterium]|jgi:hypothetical protein|nr:MoxR family ATPase [Propionibacteriaceae bacterium]
MDSTITVTPAGLPDLLLHVATVRPVFVWGAPGIGKSALVRRFAADLGLPCQTLLGAQLAPEDLIGVPELVAGPDGVTRSRFAPPVSIARTEPFCLFLDELNASSPDVQKAMYSLVLDHRLGELELPPDSVVVGAGNRATDSALARPMASALINRMVHVHLKADAADWLVWATREGLHPLVIQYLTERPGHLWSPAPKEQRPFSTPRSWHILSDCLLSYPGDSWSDHTLEVLTSGLLTPQHGSAFRAWIKVVRHRYALEPIIKGEAGWPGAPGDRDVLYFLAENFRERLVHDLPASKEGGSAAAKQFAHRSKAMLVSLAEVSLEMAQLVVASGADGQSELPAWYLTEIVRDLPRLVAARD